MNNNRSSAPSSITDLQPTTSNHRSSSSARLVAEMLSMQVLPSSSNANAQNESTRPQSTTASPSGATTTTAAVAQSPTSPTAVTPQQAAAFLLCQVLFYIAHMVTSITIIALAWNDACDAPLRTFVLVYPFRLMLSLPLTVYNRLFPSDPATTPVEEQQNRNEPETRAERAEHFIALFGHIWFLLGNWWLFTSITCGQTAPRQYYLALAILIVDYLILLFPLILILAIIFCLPLVLMLVRMLHRWFGIQLFQQTALDPLQQRRVPVHRGMSQAMVDRIPGVVFKADSMSAEDAVCTICLGGYTPEEMIKFLPVCQHHYHAKCVDDWLMINKTCPLCQRDVSSALESGSS